MKQSTTSDDNLSDLREIRLNTAKEFLKKALDSMPGNPNMALCMMADAELLIRRATNK